MSEMSNIESTENFETETTSPVLQEEKKNEFNFYAMEHLPYFLPVDMASKFSIYLGPGWEFHVEQELETRYLRYLSLSEIDAGLPDKDTKKFKMLTSELIPDLMMGDCLMNKDTLQARYNWKPEFLVRDTIKEHPDWPVHVREIDGRPCVVNIGRVPNGFAGINIPHSSRQEREEAYSTAITKYTGCDSVDVNQWVCGSCRYKNLDKSISPPRPKLMRCNAMPVYACNEKFRRICSTCK